MLNDRGIRMPLKNKLVELRRDDLIIDELNCCQGAVRVDVASIGSSLHGYEIKSELDSLNRLPFQSKAYNYVFDTLTLVSAEKHLKKALEIVPSWWGVWVVQQNATCINFEVFRETQRNPMLRTYEIACLLWKTEAWEIIQQLNLEYKKKNSTRYELWSYLADNVSADLLTKKVCEALRSRRAWRVASQQESNGDLSRHVSRSRDCQSKLSRSRSPQYICLQY